MTRSKRSTSPIATKRLSLPTRRYLCTVVCTFIASSIALYVSNLENASIARRVKTVGVSSKSVNYVRVRENESEGRRGVKMIEEGEEKTEETETMKMVINGNNNIKNDEKWKGRSSDRSENDEGDTKIQKQEQKKKQPITKETKKTPNNNNNKSIKKIASLNKNNNMKNDEKWKGRSSDRSESDDGDTKIQKQERKKKQPITEETKQTSNNNNKKSIKKIASLNGVDSKKNDEKWKGRSSDRSESDNGDTKKQEQERKKKQPLTKETKKTPNKKKKPIKKIALLGERHSGTTWLTSELQNCFPSLNVSSRLTRWKHWFQEDDGRSHFDTLVLAQFRNPYEWVEAMRRGPHHSPNHLYLKWPEFVTRPWTMPRPKRDLELKDKTGQICHNGFEYNQVVSCVDGTKEDPEFQQLLETIRHSTTFSGFKPFYELKQDGSGDPFQSILDLRAAKIENFLSVKEWKWVVDSIPVQYEKLVRDGTDYLLKQIEEAVGVKRECDASPPQKRKSRQLKQEYVEWMTEHVDWEMEKLIGYKKWGEEEGEEIGEEEEEEEQAGAETVERIDKDKKTRKDVEKIDNKAKAKQVGREKMAKNGKIE